MDHNEAKTILGMKQDDMDYQVAYDKCKTLIVERLDRAPTEMLRVEYQAMLDQLDQALSVLTTSIPGPSSLSQTGIANLSGGIPGYTDHSTGGESTSANLSLAPGQILAGRYNIKNQIGQGGMGVVFRAYDQNRSEDIAIKVLLPDLLSNESAKKRFLSEAKLSSQLSHPNIVNVFDVQNDGNYYFLTMELLEGQNLRQLMDARNIARKPFTEKEVVDIANTLADGLIYAHGKIIHRDIKPENIWIDEDDNYKIMDFGIARLMRTGQMTKTGASLGTAYYMAPEQFKGWKNIDGRADQYAMGVLMYRLLTGEIPVGRVKSVRTLHKEISKKTSDVIDRMLETIANDRFDSLEDFKAALNKKGSNVSLPAMNPKVPGIAALILVVIVIGALLGGSGGLGELWDKIRPLSAEEEQRQYSEAIQLEGEVKGLTRRLAQAKKDLEARIKEGEGNIRRLEGTIRSTGNETDKKALKQQLEQVRFDQAHNEQLQRLTNRIIYDDSGMLELEGKVQVAQSLIKDKKHPPASEVLRPIKDNLSARLNQFTQAERYLWAREKLEAAKQHWNRFNQTQQLQIPTAVERREQDIAGAERLAGQGKLAEAIEQIETHTHAYQQAYRTDQGLVQERQQHLSQQAKTRKLEKEWQAYLEKHQLAITDEQRSAIKQSNTREQNQLDHQDFASARSTSARLSLILTDYYAGSKAVVKNNQQKLVTARATKREADYRKAMKAGESAMKKKAYAIAAEHFQQALKHKPKDKKAIAAIKSNQRKLATAREVKKEANYLKAMKAGESAMKKKAYTTAMEHFQQALQHKPKDKKASKQLALASTGNKYALLKKYAPGMEVVRIPAGTFRMGDLSGGGVSNENPAHQVEIRGFGIMKHEVTFAQYDAYAESTGKDKPDDEGWGRRSRPVINVNWDEAQSYAKWLSQKTGLKFRLPSESEWEYAARAGAKTKYSWGNSLGNNKANCDGCGSQWDNKQSAPVGSFAANRYGLHDMHGNVWEWVQDCWNDSYNGAPKDGSAWMNGDCGQRVLRGGSWYSLPSRLRSAVRYDFSTDSRNRSYGFRLLQDP